MTALTVAAVGVHVLDVHVRGATAIPEGSAGSLVDSIGMSPAGTAAGTAVVFSRLGATVRTFGAVGADALGLTLLSLLNTEGVDTAGVVREPTAQTSASVIPIRSNGDRPAWHCVGANGHHKLDRIDQMVAPDVTHLHLGGPEFYGGPAAATLLGAAKARGITTSVDILAGGDPGLLAWIADALPHVDYLLPNDEQIRGFTGVVDLTAAARQFLDHGVGCVALTCGGDGALVVTDRDTVEVPAFAIEVVDTTGCGDAFSAGFLTGRAEGLGLGESATLGCAVAAHVAQGIGTTAGDYDLARIREYAGITATGAEIATTRRDAASGRVGW
ncbi:carbohydrate kinase family protein [Mycolicibacterium neoaurum]|uniref:carbohydrate kinase family protein n=1 Tax=Mycolicibacterium neoaurum TaxID=1795 RepID=UPI001F4D04A0|nr:PfkB family carbohydrate kinase [Mycolicibacterium neoaurum]